MVDLVDGRLDQGQQSDTLEKQGNNTLSREEDSSSEADSSAIIIPNFATENSLSNSNTEVNIQCCNGSNGEIVKEILDFGNIPATNSSYIEPDPKAILNRVSERSSEFDDIVIDEANIDKLSIRSSESKDIVNEAVSVSSLSSEEPESSHGPKCWVCKQGVNTTNQREVFCDCLQGYPHKECLIEWMNKFCKGRCPVCAFKFRVVAHQKPMSEWAVDPLLKQSKKRYIIMATLNVVVVIVVAIVLVELLQNFDEKKKEKTIIASVICVISVLYIFHQTRLYWRVYERMKIYNNKVIDVFERSISNQGIVRCNMSSLINESEIHK